MARGLAGSAGILLREELELEEEEEEKKGEGGSERGRRRGGGRKRYGRVAESRD